MFYYFDIKNAILEPSFDNNIYSYNVYIDDDIDKLDLHFKMDKDSRINVIGNNNLSYGDNYIFIELTKDNILKTYTLIVHKEKTSEVMSYNKETKLEVKSSNNYYKYIIPMGYILIIIVLYIIFFKKKELNK